MKILEVKLRNLNSLRGDHTVELNREPLQSAGIFAITGPTGSGKSTLLDAITLALYGRAARYGTEKNPEHMMSRHCGNCAAEVIFEIPEGVYRAEWQLHRARGKADGKLQPPKRFIYNSAGTVLARQIKEADQLVESLCGLSYERFMRSVLLAQGEFARFLKAKADERAELLESLTGTTIYTELGQLAHEEASHRSKELLLKEERLGLMRLLDEAEREERKTEIDRLKKSSKTHKKRVEKITSIQAHATELAKQQEEQSDLNALLAEIASEIEASASSFSLLNTHREAAPLIPALQRHDDHQTALTKAEGSEKEARELREKTRVKAAATACAANDMAKKWLSRQDHQLAAIEQDVDQAEASLGQLESWLKEHGQDRPLADRISSISAQLTELVNLNQHAKQLNSDLCSLTEQTGSLNVEQSKERERLQLARGSFRQAIVERGRAASRVLELTPQAGIQSLKQSLDQARETSINLARLAQSQEAAENERRKLEKSRKHLEKLSGELPETEKTHRSAIAEQENAKALLKSFQDHLRTAEQMASLEEHRAQLEKDSPCPLCGSTEHPYADDCHTESLLQELKDKVAAGEKQLEATASKVEKVAGEVAQLNARIETGKGIIAEQTESTEALETERNAAAKALGLKGSIKEAQDTNKKLIESYSKTMTAVEQANTTLLEQERRSEVAKGELGKLEIALDRTNKAQSKLQQSVSQNKEQQVQLKEKQQRQVGQAEKNLSDFGFKKLPAGSENETLTILQERQSAFAETEKAASDKRLQLKELKAGLQAGKEARKRTLEISKRFQDKAESESFANNLPPQGRSDSIDLWKDLDTASSELEQAENEFIQAGTTLKERSKAKNSAVDLLAKSRSDLESVLSSSDFDSVTELRAALLPETEAKELTEQKEHIDKRKADTEARLKQVASAIERIEKEDALSPEALTKLDVEKAELTNELDILSTRMAELQAELNRDEANRKEQADGLAALKGEQDECKTWELLRGLIGSHDGAKFRRFAQGISLDILVHHANHHLSRLSDRYRLERATEEELELEIIDLYQAGIARPMSSLSGGESFLASLALALGLSALAGRNVRIDSLFIDEGFGTLDPETLDVAISALESLQLDNKIVGVISHVELLKERISTQIEVQKLPGGMSHLMVTPSI